MKGITTMSWNDFYRRQDILDGAENAAAERDGAALLEEVPGASEEFGTRENLLLALHYRWSLLLSGHLRTELSDARDGEHADAVARAWRSASAARPGLRKAIAGDLDATPRLRAMHETDLRTLAIAAELAEPDEPTTEITKTGAAFLALSTQHPAPRARRSGERLNPAERLARMLAPAG